MEQEVIPPGRPGWIGLRRALVFTALPALPLAGVVFGVLSMGYGAGCSMAGCSQVPLLLVAFGGLLGVNLLAALSGDAFPHTVWVSRDGVAFGWVRPGRRIPWSELVGPLEAPRWGVVSLLRRRPHRRPSVAGVVTTSQLRRLTLRPDFPVRQITPWAWEALGLEPPAVFASFAGGLEYRELSGSSPPPASPQGFRFPFREAAVARRRHLVLLCFTAPASTLAVGVLVWFASGAPGMALGAVGACILGWNVGFRLAGRPSRPPDFLWVGAWGLAVERRNRRGARLSRVVPWRRVVLYTATPSERVRFYLKIDPRARGTAAAFVRVPDSALPLISAGPPRVPSAPRTPGVPAPTLHASSVTAAAA